MPGFVALGKCVQFNAKELTEPIPARSHIRIRYCIWHSFYLLFGLRFPWLAKLESLLKLLTALSALGISNNTGNALSLAIGAKPMQVHTSSLRCPRHSSSLYSLRVNVAGSTTEHRTPADTSWSIPVMLPMISRCIAAL